MLLVRSCYFCCCCCRCFFFSSFHSIVGSFTFCVCLDFFRWLKRYARRNHINEARSHVIGAEARCYFCWMYIFSSRVVDVALGKRKTVCFMLANISSVLSASNDKGVFHCLFMPCFALKPNRMEKSDGGSKS